MAEGLLQLKSEVLLTMFWGSQAYSGKARFAGESHSMSLGIPTRNKENIIRNLLQDENYKIRLDPGMSEHHLPTSTTLPT